MDHLKRTSDVDLFPDPAFMALATSVLLAAFSYPRRRRYPAAVSMAALSIGLNELHHTAASLTADLLPFAVGIATGL